MLIKLAPVIRSAYLVPVRSNVQLSVVIRHWGYHYVMSGIRSGQVLEPGMFSRDTVGKSSLQDPVTVEEVGSWVTQSTPTSGC